jgi:hypothetical protein
MTIDSQSSDIDIAMELGFRVAQVATDRYQYQKVDNKGKTVAVQPSSPHAHQLWVKLVTTARQLGAAIEGGKEGGGAQSGKSDAPQVA